MSFVTDPSIDWSKLPRPVLSDHPHWVAMYDLAWQLAARHIRQTRTGRCYVDVAWDPSRNFQWVWDTCFLTFYCRYAADQFPGIQSLDNFYDLQRDDGYISMTYDMDSGEEPYPDRVNPPLFAWAEWEYYRATGDDSRLPRVVEHIEKLMAWIERNRKNAPHFRRLPVDSEIVGDARRDHKYQLYWFADGGSSGMDDSPRGPRCHEAGRFFDWVDLSSQVAMASSHLALMRRHLGDEQKAAQHQQHAHAIGQLVNEELWSPVTRFYHDRMIPTNFIASKTIAGFWPMVAGFCPQERVADLVEHLDNPREFSRPTPIPSLSADDLNYCPRGTYWLGGVWAPTNYMVLRGLACCGRGDVAHRITARYLEALHETWRDHQPHTIWECCAPEASSPGLSAYVSRRVKPDFVGWSGLGPIAMLIENIIGLELDAPARHVAWTIRLTEEHGLQQLRVPGGFAGFRCAKRTNPGDSAQVTLQSDVPLQVTLDCAGRTREVALHAGERASLRV